ncbi:unnamed protein product [Trichobilharzia szidati]|nr:unnamed protein product [Trichobilharzia szidati]
MENNHLSHSVNSSEDVWLPRSSCPVTSSDSERNHNISDFGFRTNLDETGAHLEKANSIPRSLRSFLRKAASLKESCSVSSTKCSVICLDGRCLRFNVHKLALGRQLLDTVCQYLELEEPQYFGLVFYLNRKADRNSVLGTCQNEESSSGNNQDGPDKPFRISSSSSSSINNSYSTRFCGCPLTNSFNPCKVYSYHSTYPGFNPFFIDVPFWLDTEKRITDQCHGSKLIFYFQVKFYPQHPDRVFECPKSRHQFCLQLRQHLCIGRLLCSFETHVILGALIAQMVLGDAIKYQRSHSAHLSCRSIHCAESTSHTYSRQQSTSLTHSLSSERRCSLAEPEHSDNSIIWDSQKDKDGKNNEVKYHPSSSVNKRNTFSHIGCSCSTQQIDNTSMIYLQCLPHLARGSVTSSSIHQSTYDITSNSRPSLSSTAMFNNIEDVLLSPLANNFSPGWPYPKSNCQYCPVLLSRITRLHRKFRGMLQEDAEKSFLENVKKLAFYGVELHPVKKFHATYISTGSFKKLAKKLVRSFSDRSQTSPTESYHNFTDEYSMNGSNQTLNSSKGNKSLSRSSIKSSLQRIFNIKREGSALFPFAFNDFPNFDFSLGVYHAGVFLQWGHLRLSHYTWSQIVKVCYHSDEFSIVVRDNVSRLDDKNYFDSSCCQTKVFNGNPQSTCPK